MVNFSEFYSKIRSVSALNNSLKQVQKIKQAQAKLKQKTIESLKSDFNNLRTLPSDSRTVPGFAIVCEMASRILGQNPYDVQIAGGLALLEGQLSEMRTGEGKTLTIAAPAALLALETKGVHIVTANEYLATRDCENLRNLYESLGLTVASLTATDTADTKKKAYAADITYGVSAEFGFDYLKDNLVTRAEDKVQRLPFAAIVDEIDYVLIDEARIPLIIAETATATAQVVELANRSIQVLAETDVIVILNKQDVTITEAGYKKIEAELEKLDRTVTSKTLYQKENLHIAKCIHSAVKAKYLFKRGRDYLVENGEIILIDTGTGRKMEGRRLEDGLHEALEAAELLAVKPTSVTRASITFQCYFSLYARLSGLTGTASTDAEEFLDVYGLDTVVVPTNRPVVAETKPDLVFLTKSEKFNAAIDLIRNSQIRQQPVLVGCASVRDALALSSLLSKQSVEHQLLTAKNKEEEAHIIANAGRPGQVTVATNMAGRGTDIMLGGERPNKEAYLTEDEFQRAESAWKLNRDIVISTGGLFVIGTERNGIRRVDNQLAGRCGRQGEVGCSQFFLSLEDDLLKNFGKSKQLFLIRKMIENSNGVLSGPLISKLVTTAQKTYEKQGFSSRKALRDFDSVVAEQRTSVYELRNHLLDDLNAEYCGFAVNAAIGRWVDEQLQGDSALSWDLAVIKESVKKIFGITPPLIKWVVNEQHTEIEIRARLKQSLKDEYARKAPSHNEATKLMLGLMTEIWTEHLTALDELNRSLALKGFTGLNPFFQFKNDAYALFEYFESELHTRYMVSAFSFHENQRKLEEQRAINQKVIAIENSRWVSRNEKCPCNSGLSYKKCHGKVS